MGYSTVWSSRETKLVFFIFLFDERNCWQLVLVSFTLLLFSILQRERRKMVGEGDRCIFCICIFLAVFKNCFNYESLSE